MVTIYTLPLTTWYVCWSTWWLFVYIGYSLAQRRLIQFKELEPMNKTRRFVILVPCHNEERVIANTINSFMSLDYPKEHYTILIIDDASTDATSKVVKDLQTRYTNLQLLVRTQEEGSKGKSEALNAGYRWLRETLLRDATDNYIVGVCDADGQTDNNLLWCTERIFDDERVGGCQAGIRIKGRDNHILLRYQDMEFSLYSYITQNIRSLFGNASLGGNGQFITRQALDTIHSNMNGHDYWWNPFSLTEDLEVGLRLIMNGYRVVTIPGSFVHQQGLTNFRNLILRQRTRWSWGTLQVTVKYLLSLRLFIDTKLTLLQKIDWVVLLTLWGISVTLPLVWLLSIMHLLSLINVGTSVTLALALGIGFAWIPLIILGLREIPEYRDWRVILWATGFFFYLLHGIFCYYYALYKLLFFKPKWDKTDRSHESQSF